jgi:hypothetical protein
MMTRAMMTRAMMTRTTKIMDHAKPHSLQLK